MYPKFWFTRRTSVGLVGVRESGYISYRRCRSPRHQMFDMPSTNDHARSHAKEGSRPKYRPPNNPQTIRLDELFDYCGRPVADARSDLFRKDGEAEPII